MSSSWLRSSKSQETKPLENLEDKLFTWTLFHSKVDDKEMT